MAYVIRQCMEIQEAGQPLVFAERPLPPPSSTGVILKTSYAGVCHSDVPFWEDEFPQKDGSVFRCRDTEGFQLTGVTMGHEIGGMVHAVGDQVKDVSVGDRVVVYSWIGCTQCAHCKAGYTNMCQNNRHGTTDFGQGTVASGCLNQGGYSTYVWVSDSKSVVPIPDSIPMQTACTLPCAALTAYSALLHVKSKLQMFADIYANPSLVINGCGGLGIWCLKLAPYVIPVDLNLVAMDISSSKLDVAVAKGATNTVLMTDDDQNCIAELRQKTGGGVCAMIDFVGLTRTINIGIQSLCRGGQIHLIGLYGGEVSVSGDSLISASLGITASRTATLSQLRNLVDIVAQHQISGPPIDEVKLTDINRVLCNLKVGNSRGRTVVKF